MFLLAGTFSVAEAASLHIGILEAVSSFWSSVVFSRHFSEVTHILEFTDNSGSEWASRRETPYLELLQRVVARRASFLFDSGVFVTSNRVSSAANVWADALSRQNERLVLEEAAALELRVHWLSVPPALRDLSWLTAA